MPEPLYLDPELAAKADALFRELGLDLSLAVQLFLRQSLRERGLPFTLRLTDPDRPASTGPNPVEQENEATPSCVDAEDASPDAMEATPPEERESTVFASSGPTDGEQSCERAEEPEIPNAAKQKNDALAQRKDDAEAQSESGADTDVHAENEGGELRQAFLNARLIGAPLRRVRSLNRLYSIGEPNDHVQGWREVYVSGDEPFALDFGSVRVELGFHGGGSLRMMDGRLPDAVLEADAVYPRDLSAVFSSVIGQRLVDVSSSRLWNEGREREQLCLRFANGCALNFAPGGDWCALWLTDAHGAVMFAPEAVWLRVLDDRTRNGLR